jgi:SNF2 family DNA or RNA helicase
MSGLTATYGTVELDGKFWVVRCEPHVRVRLKRVFGRVHTREYNHLKLADSPETCRELLWFVARYPMEIPELDYLQEQSARHEREEQMIFQVVHGHVAPANFDLALPLRDYQRIATDLALKTGGLLVADDVGLGKTAVAIGMFTDQRTLPALVVTLTHLPLQWQREINRFAPTLKTHIIKKGTPYEMGNGAFPDVLITNYHKLRGWADILANQVRSVVWDEVQELRRGRDSLKGAAAHHIAQHVGFRVGLSATPVYNHGAEMFNIMECVRPGALGPRDEFDNEWTSWHGERVTDPKAFGTYLRDAGLMLRRTREDVQRELQPLTKVPHWIAADFEALDKIASSADELALTIVNQEQLKQTDRFATEREFNALLRQATGIAKAPYVAEFVRMLCDRGEQVVLYGWHREFYSLVMDRLKDCRPAMYTGTETPKQKDAAVQRFMDRDAQVLLISLRSGAGLDGLQHHCRTVVFGELDWSPGAMEQCVGRVHRDGQLDEVTAYYLLAEVGADPFMSKVLGIKRAQIEGIKDPAGGALPVYDMAGDSIRQLARDYLEQRKRESTASSPNTEQLTLMEDTG